jgi:glycosyltransferase involved in cell wall biosynthesis
VISIVTPTLRRPTEIVGLLENLAQQSVCPSEVIIIDGASLEEKESENAIKNIGQATPFPCTYIRQSGGTAIQRNAGINAAKGKYVAFVDDDVRLEADFLENAVAVFERDTESIVGGVVGYRTNQHFTPKRAQRWRWYRRLRLLTVYEPGRYDFQTGYPINANLQRPFRGTRPVDFMTTACAVWRREVFESGLRFDPFFRDYGMLEDAHFSLRAGKTWRLLQCGDARCEELHSPGGRVESRRIGFKCVVNYYYVFKDVVGPLSWRQQRRFWSFQAFELFRVFSSAIRRRRASDLRELQGRIEGIRAVVSGAI